MKTIKLLNYAIDCIIKLCYYNLANKKAVTPTKNEPPPIKKKGKPIITQSAERYKIMTVYRIKITGSEYNEDYTFTEPAEGSIKEEVAAILEEMKKGNIGSLEVKKEA